MLECKIHAFCLLQTQDTMPLQFEINIWIQTEKQLRREADGDVNGDAGGLDNGQ